MRAFEAYDLWHRHFSTVQHIQDDDEMRLALDVSNVLAMRVMRAQVRTPADVAALVAVCAETEFGMTDRMKTLRRRVSAVLGEDRAPILWPEC